MASSFSANVMGVQIDPKTVFPDQVRELEQLKESIAGLTAQLQVAEDQINAAQSSVNALGALNMGNMSFRGKNSPSVYAAYNKNANDYVARGNFSINGFPFRVSNANSFNSVLAQMKEKRKQVGQTLSASRNLAKQASNLQSQVAKLDTNLKTKTAKLRKNIANYTAKVAKNQRRGLSQTSPTYGVMAPSARVAKLTASTAARNAPKPTFGQRFKGLFSRKTRRNNRK